MVNALSKLDRFKKVLQALVFNNYVTNEKEIAPLIGENNPQGLTDIKSGKKKLLSEHLERLYNSFPKVNKHYINEDLGAPLVNDEEIEVDILMDQIINEPDREKRRLLVVSLMDSFNELKTENLKLKGKLQRIKLAINNV